MERHAAQQKNHFGLVVVAFEAANKFIESLPAAVGGGAVLAALVLAIIALLVAGGVSDRVEELTEKIEELEGKIEELKSNDEDEADSWLTTPTPAAGTPGSASTASSAYAAHSLERGSVAAAASLTAASRATAAAVLVRVVAFG